MRTAWISCFALSLSLGAPQVFADEEAEYLLQSCKDLVNIFSQFDEEKPLAFFTTSREDAMRAGYCQGATDQFRRQHYRCAANDWFEQAQKITQVTANSAESKDIESLLELSCAR